MPETCTVVLLALGLPGPPAFVYLLSKDEALLAQGMCLEMLGV